MNKTTFEGKVLHVGEPVRFNKDAATFSYRDVLFDLGDSILATKFWQEDELPKVGKDVKIVVRIYSERNNKDPKLFYHKINLIGAYELSRTNKTIQHEEGCDSSDRTLNY